MPSTKIAVPRFRITERDGYLLGICMEPLDDMGLATFRAGVVGFNFIAGTSMAEADHLCQLMNKHLATMYEVTFSAADEPVDFERMEPMGNA